MPTVVTRTPITLVAGTGDTDNASFTIVGDELRSATGFNFEGQSSFSILVRSTDSSSLFFEQVVLISVTDVNEAPAYRSSARALLPMVRWVVRPWRR